MKMPALARLYPAATTAAILLAVSTLTRIVLAFRPEVAALDAADLIRAFAFGLAFDGAAAAYALAPFVLWLAFAPDRLARTWIYRAASIAWFGIATTTPETHASSEQSQPATIRPTRQLPCLRHE